MREVEALGRRGIREVTLLGQNVNSYGRGLKERTSFADLLRHLQAETDVRRLRFTTSHPKDLTDDLMQHFHLENNLLFPAFEPRPTAVSEHETACASR